MISRRLLSVLVLSSLAVATVCSAQTPSASPPPSTAPAPAPPAAAPPPTPIRFEEALLRAANDLFSKAALPAGAADKVTLVIDPLIDGVTGSQSVATRSMGRRIVELVRASYQRFDVKPFSSAEVAKAPIVLIGTFTPINNAGQAAGPRDAYRICLALADLGTKKIISKGVARATFDGINPTPVGFFTESPVFAKDTAIESYVKSCQGTQPGGPIDAAYMDRIQAATLVSDAIEAYGRRRYRDALNLYRSALKTPAGDQLRALNGIYLANLRLGRRAEAAAAFGKLVDYGLTHDRLAVKFLFRAGSTSFASLPPTPYRMWISQIARRGEASTACLEVTGHTSATGPAPLNDRLSLLRAEHVKDLLTDEKPGLGRRVIAAGRGSRNNLIGTGKDDASDSLDRRVEFAVVTDCKPPARSARAALGEHPVR